MKWFIWAWQLYRHADPGFLPIIAAGVLAYVAARWLPERLIYALVVAGLSAVLVGSIGVGAIVVWTSTP